LLVAHDVAGVGAKAMTHLSAKWAWLGEAAGPGRHVVRLSYGRGESAESATGAASAVDTSDAAMADLARRDLSHLLGLPVGPEQVLASAVQRWPHGLARLIPGRRERVVALREDLARDWPGLHVIGAGIAGNGLAAVIADTRQALEPLTRSNR
jgi:oxygen-dependent protoporphyrinogen oxidase